MSTTGLLEAEALHLPLRDGSVHCVVTSPPYWELRDYGTARWDGGDPGCDHRPPTWADDRGDLRGVGSAPLEANAAKALQRNGMACRKCGAVRIDKQLGLEPTPELYVQHMVMAFREVRRVLRDDGTLWLNMGDCYANARSWGGKSGAKNYTSAAGGYPRHKVGPGLGNKQLVGIPWRVAFALQADGWYLRSDIIWHKPNPMPESVQDRPTKAHEYLFLLTKNERYFYDAEAIREERSEYKVPKGQLPEWEENGRGTAPGQAPNSKAFARNRAARAMLENPAGRNRRTVWTIATQPFRGAHFATMPAALVEPCVLAGTSAYGCCPMCGAPWIRVFEKRSAAGRGSGNVGRRIATDGESGRLNTHLGFSFLWNPTFIETTGWRPTCACAIDCPDCAAREGETNTLCFMHRPVPATVLDPFAGSGTVGLVAAKHNRNFVGLDLNLTYLAELATKRVDIDQSYLLGLDIGIR